jgi:hypothetical protein
MDTRPDDTGEDGFTDRPVPPVPPWQLPGNFRLDREPHRAGLLLSLGVVGLGMGFLSAYFAPLALLGAPLLRRHPVLHPALAAVALAGMLLGVLGWALAQKDLARMRQGLADPAGEDGTRYARAVAATAGFLGATAAVTWALTSLGTLAVP